MSLNTRLRRSLSVYMVLIYFAAGAAINLGVAILFAVSTTPIMDAALVTGMRTSHASAPRWLYMEIKRFGITWLYSSPGFAELEMQDDTDFKSLLQALGPPSIPAWSCMNHRPEEIQNKAPADVATGWPLRSFHASYDSIETLRSSPNATVDGGLLLNRSTPAIIAKVIPFAPIWSGVLFGSAFYAVIIWGFHSIFLLLLRAKRIVNLHCPMCNYQLTAGQIGCSECGWNRGEGERVETTSMTLDRLTIT